MAGVVKLGLWGRHEMTDSSCSLGSSRERPPRLQIVRVLLANLPLPNSRRSVCSSGDFCIPVLQPSSHRGINF